MVFIFWIIILLTVYTYIGYPLFLNILIKFKNFSNIKKADFYPFVSVIVPAYNEGNSIEKKIQNVLSLDYPTNKIEIIIASDCSTDNTDEIVKSYLDKGVILCRLEKRGGKVAAYDQAIKLAKGKVLVFSDATSILEKKSVKRMMQSFNDPKVGCVAGMLKYEEPDNVSVGKGEHSYWQYNKNITYLEGKIDSMTSVSGTFFAVRKELYPSNIKGNLAEDLIVPLNVRRNNFETILEPAAICIESTVTSQDQEVRKRSRITVQNLHGLGSNLDMLNIFKYGLFSVFLFSHKILRSISALLLISIIVINIVLLNDSSLYLFILISQIIFYSAGLLGSFWIHNRPRLLNYIYFFCLSNYSIFIGILKALSGYKVVTWDTER